MTDKLKPCPICFGELRVFGNMKHPVEHFYIGCVKNDCFQYDKDFTSPKQALEAWNDRFTPPEMHKDYTHPENMYKNQENLDTSEAPLSPAHLAALGMLINLE